MSAAAIAAARPDLIVPCDDRAVSHLLSIGAHAPEVAALLARSMGRLESYPMMMARRRAIAVAQAEGISVPLTVAVANEYEFWRALKSVGLPAVLKPDGSWGGEGVAVMRTPEQASRAFRKEALAPKAVSLQVQQFIRGKPATSAFACCDGEVLAAIHMDVVESRGTTGSASLIRRTDCSRMDEAARRIARRFELGGLHGLDFVRDESGIPHLIEINPRAAQICHLALGAGHDLPSALLGQKARPVATDKPLIALLPQAWSSGRLSPDAQTAYLDVAWDDPAVVSAAIDSGFTLFKTQPERNAPAATEAFQFLTDGLEENAARPHRLRL
jgi:predicted ATP-grasp superfamily ATP-dependent carboligase